MAAENKTAPTSVAIEDFLATVSPERAAEARQLIAIMERISGKPPVMWGPSIIGFGAVHYSYTSGREGDMPHLGFSPRKANLTIYFMEGFEAYADELAVIGPHKISKACLYVTNLSKIDTAVLTRMIKHSYDTYNGGTDGK